jgi:predicted HicB family RNase H-like nuclease
MPEDHTMAGKKPGPVPRGPRSQFTLRLPPGHRALYKAHADAEGISLADYITRALAEMHDLDLPAYLQRHNDRAQLNFEISA